MTSLAEVWLWGTRIGAVALESGSRVANFEYDPAFLPSGIQLSPLHLPLVAGVHAFPDLTAHDYDGMPGLLAASLPGRFANTLVDAWLSAQGREPNALDAVQRLLFVGDRGTGALEFRPASAELPSPASALDIDALARMVDRVQQLGRRSAEGYVDAAERRSLEQLIAVASRTQGSAPTALVDAHRPSGELRASSDVLLAGYEASVLQFDPLEPCPDGPNAPSGRGALMHAYAMLARSAGIDVAETSITVHAGRRHVLTRRIDRGTQGKVHLHSLRTMAHYDSHREQSVEQLFAVVRRLGLDAQTVEQAYARVVFQLLAHDWAVDFDDYVFAMNRRGQWSLAPACGLSYRFAPGPEPASTRMSLRGKRTDFDTTDLGHLAADVSLPRGRALRIARRVQRALLRWPEFAREAGLGAEWTDRVQQGLLLDLIPAG